MSIFIFREDIDFWWRKRECTWIYSTIIDSSRKITSSPRKYWAVPFKFSTLTNRMVSGGLLCGDYCIEMAPATLWKLQLLKRRLTSATTAITTHNFARLYFRIYKKSSEKTKKEKSNPEVWMIHQIILY